MKKTPLFLDIVCSLKLKPHQQCSEKVLEFQEKINHLKFDYPIRRFTYLKKFPLIQKNFLFRTTEPIALGYKATNMSECTIADNKVNTAPGALEIEKRQIIRIYDTTDSDEPIPFEKFKSVQVLEIESISGP